MGYYHYDEEVDVRVYATQAMKAHIKVCFTVINEDYVRAAVEQAGHSAGELGRQIVELQALISVVATDVWKMVEREKEEEE